MMLGSNQEQDVANNSTAIQAGRDVHYHGLSLADVREVCELLLAQNAPRLAAAAQEVAEQRVREFAQTFVNEMSRAAQTVVIDKFSEPDVQAALNDAVRAAARRGTDANPEILAKLVIGRMAESTTPFVDIVLSEAVQVVSKLTKQQLSFLAFIHTFRAVAPKPPSLDAFEIIARCVNTVVSDGFGMSMTKKYHLHYAGALAISTNVGSIIFASDGGSAFSALFSRYGAEMGFADVNAMKFAFSQHAPSFHKLAGKWDEENAMQCELTSVGQAIAVSILMPVLPFPGMNYQQWLA